MIRAFALILASILLLPMAVAIANTPFVQGVVNGQWIGAVLQAGGAGGNVYILPIYAQNAGQVAKIGELQPSSLNGGTISAVFFANGKMYVTDDLVLPGECEACHDYATVRRFAVIGETLRQDAVGIVRYPNNGANSARFRKIVLASALRATPGGPEVGQLPRN